PPPLAPQLTVGDARRPRLTRTDPPPPLVLPYRIADRPAAMVRCKHVNIVLFPLPPSPAFYRISRLHFLDLDGKRHPFHPQLHRLPQQLLRPPRPVQPHRLLPPLKPERADQPDHAEDVVRVEMREEDVGERERHAVAHHLALRPLAALEQQGLPLAHESEGGNVALDRRPCG